MKNPMVRLSKAEQALAEAGDIVDILELRTKAKAVEVIAIAENLGEIAQQAKIFQIRAERKAGAWLTDHIKPGRPTGEETVKLEDLEISYNDSSRWQLMAKVPDAKFVAWVDERLSRGQEITSGGLRMYAKNLLGLSKAGYSRSTRLLLKPDGGCALQGYAIRCDGPPQNGHIIHKGEVRGNDEARAILAACPKEIMSIQCSAHNVDRWANTHHAKRIQLLQKIYEFGWSHMEDWFENFLSIFKVRPHELTLQALLEYRSDKIK
jgi:hypothetical protein